MQMQNINETLDRAIKAGDIKAIREELKSWILYDPGFTKKVFDNNVDYCKEKGISEAELFVPFSGEPLNEDRAVWTKQYFASAQMEFDSNFSRERLAHLKKVGGKLYPPESPSPHSSNQEGDKKKSATPLSIPAQARQPAGRKRGSVWWIVAAGIGIAAFLWSFFRRK
jgi:hypothetical protein